MTTAHKIIFLLFLFFFLLLFLLFFNFLLKSLTRFIYLLYNMSILMSLVYNISIRFMTDSKIEFLIDLIGAYSPTVFIIGPAKYYITIFMRIFSHLLLHFLPYFYTGFSFLLFGRIHPGFV